MSQTNQPTEEQLTRMLDQARIEVFRGDNAAFLASILCSLDFRWWDETESGEVGTDGKTLFWKRSDFLRCSPDERKYTLIHEIWHPASLHFVRGLGKDQGIWNDACDYVINNRMIRDGRQLPNNGYWLFDLSIDEGGTLSEEQVYDKLVKSGYKARGHKDMVPVPVDPHKQNVVIQQQVAMVIRAQQAAVSAGKPGTVPGSVQNVLDRFLHPVVPWRQALAQWMTDLVPEDYSWSNRNRRFPRIYMPSRELVPDSLDSVVFFIDTSASITDQTVVRFNSEVKYIWEDLKPKRLIIVQFDTQVHDVRVFNEGDEFEDIQVYGRGGTCLDCVREWIEENNPTAVLVFSDLECEKMEKPTENIPFIWAKSPGDGHTPDFGTVIHVID